VTSSLRNMNKQQTTYTILIHDKTSTAQDAACSTATLHPVKHVEVTFLPVSLGRHRTGQSRIPDDKIRIRTNRNTTLSTAEWKKRSLTNK